MKNKIYVFDRKVAIMEFVLGLEHNKFTQGYIYATDNFNFSNLYVDFEKLEYVFITSKEIYSELINTERVYIRSKADLIKELHNIYTELPPLLLKKKLNIIIDETK